MLTTPPPSTSGYAGRGRQVSRASTRKRMQRLFAVNRDVKRRIWGRASLYGIDAQTRRALEYRDKMHDKLFAPLMVALEIELHKQERAEHESVFRNRLAGYPGVTKILQKAEVSGE